MIPSLIIVIALGLIVGSFLNALLWRLHSGKSIVTGRSQCTKCSHQLAWGDLVPVLSYCVLRGRCRYCNAPISWQYPSIELVTTLLFVAFFVRQFPLGLGGFEDIGRLVLSLFFCSVLIIIFIYDLRWGLILDKVTLPAVVITFLGNLFLSPSALMSMLLAGLVGGGFFIFQYLISRGTWIGGGDIRLGVLMGFMVGWPHIITALFLAYMIGSVVSLALLACKKAEFGGQIPLGPFLVAGTIIVLLFRPTFDFIFQRYFL